MRGTRCAGPLCSLAQSRCWLQSSKARCPHGHSGEIIMMHDHSKTTPAELMKLLRGKGRSDRFGHVSPGPARAWSSPAGPGGPAGSTASAQSVEMIVP